MATADFSKASTFDEQAAAWSDFLVRYRIECRERKEVGIAACVYPFYLEEKEGEKFVHFPQIPELLPDFPTKRDVSKCLSNDPIAYLLLMPGMPVSDIEAKRIEVKKDPTPSTIIKVRDSMIDEGEFQFYLMGVFISKQLKQCFCSAFDGEKFGPLRVGAAAGGPLEDLIDFEA